MQMPSFQHFAQAGDYLGGEAYWAGGVHLYTPLPFRPGRGGFGDLFRTHFFLNAGNLCNLNYGKTQQNEKALFSSYKSKKESCSLSIHSEALYLHTLYILHIFWCLSKACCF